MTTTGFNLPALATATVGLLGHDWETAQIASRRAAVSIQHRDAKHNGFVITVAPYGHLTVQASDSEPLAVLQTISPAQDIDHVAGARGSDPRLLQEGSCRVWTARCRSKRCSSSTAGRKTS